MTELRGWISAGLGDQERLFLPYAVDPMALHWEDLITSWFDDLLETTYSSLINYNVSIMCYSCIWILHLYVIGNILNLSLAFSRVGEWQEFMVINWRTVRVDGYVPCIITPVTASNQVDLYPDHREGVKWVMSGPSGAFKRETEMYSMLRHHTHYCHTILEKGHASW